MGRLSRYSEYLLAGVVAFSSGCGKQEQQVSPLEVQINESTPLVWETEGTSALLYLAGLAAKEKQAYHRADGFFSDCLNNIRAERSKQELKRDRLYSMTWAELALNLVDLAEYEAKKGNFVLIVQPIGRYLLRAEEIWENKIALYTRGRIEEAVNNYEEAYYFYSRAKKRKLPMKKREHAIDRDLDERMKKILPKLRNLTLLDDMLPRCL